MFQMDWDPHPVGARSLGGVERQRHRDGSPDLAGKLIGTLYR